jgi:hypothetical protein
VEREYRNRDDLVRLTIVRSYDLKSLYHHPELAVAYGSTFGSSFGSSEVMRFGTRAEVPVHLLRPTAGARAMGLYVLEYDGEYVDNPLWFQARTAGRLLVSRRKAMTLFFAHDLAVPDDADIEHLPALQLIFAALDSFSTQPIAPNP